MFVFLMNVFEIGIICRVKSLKELEEEEFVNMLKFKVCLLNKMVIF